MVQNNFPPFVWFLNAYFRKIKFTNMNTVYTTNIMGASTILQGQMTIKGGFKYILAFAI